MQTATHQHWHQACPFVLWRLWHADLPPYLDSASSLACSVSCARPVTGQADHGAHAWAVAGFSSTSGGAGICIDVARDSGSVPRPSLSLSRRQVPQIRSPRRPQHWIEVMRVRHVLMQGMSHTQSCLMVQGSVTRTQLVCVPQAGVTRWDSLCTTRPSRCRH